MAGLNRLRALLRLLLHREAVESDLDAEISTFYEMMVERYTAQGMTDMEARRRARLQFQSSEQVKERVRDVRTGAALTALGRDIKYALRGIRRAPSLAFVIVLTLGLGIGANATIFSIISRFVLNMPPVGDPTTLLSVHTTHDGERCCNNFSWPLYEELRDNAKSFAGLAGYYELVPASIDGTGDPERVWGQAATANFFDVTQLPLTLGRGFRNEESNVPVVVLGHGLWQRRFNADGEVVGKIVHLSGRPFTVIGVAPPLFRGLDVILDCQFWVPLGNLDQLLPDTSDHTSRFHHWINVIGRLQPGLTNAHAASELKLIAQRLAKAYPESEKGGGFRLQQAGSLPPRDKVSVEIFFTALTLLALLVLCIACANVANLALAQASARQREAAVRVALGATRGDLLRQILTESVVLAFGGGVCGAALSVWATHGLGAFHLPAPVPLDLTVPVDSKALLYTFVLSGTAGVLCGLAPGLAVVRRAIAGALKGDDVLVRPGRIWNLRNILVISQIAMSLVLLCSTGLFLHSLDNAARVDIGFRSRGVLMMAVDPRLHGYNSQRITHFLAQLRQRAAALPGVVSAAYTDSVPLSGGFRSDSFHIDGGSTSSAAGHDVDLYMVSPAYLDTIGIPLLEGRDFAHESAGTPRVAVVNQAFAKVFFQNASAIGQRVTGGGRSYQIIGVVGNMKSRTLGEGVRPVLFRALAQDVGADPSFAGYSLLVRFTGPERNVANGVRREIRALDPSLAIFKSETMEEHIRDAFFLPRLSGVLFGVFGAIGLTLASVGLYALMSYWVGQRTREIGIRLALGARVGQIQRFIIGRGMLLTLIALAPGLSLALAVTKLFSSVLYGVSAHDPWTFAAVPLFLSAVAFLACWIPSRRAAGVEPLTALRHE